MLSRLRNLAARLSTPPEPVTVPIARVLQPARAVAVADVPLPVGGPADDERDAERFVPDVTHTVVTTTSGRRATGRILNLSRTGVALELESRDVTPEEVTMVGARRVLPGRRMGLGMVLVFEKPIDARACHRGIVL